MEDVPVSSSGQERREGQRHERVRGEAVAGCVGQRSDCIQNGEIEGEIALARPLARHRANGSVVVGVVAAVLARHPLPPRANG